MSSPIHKPGDGAAAFILDNRLSQECRCVIAASQLPSTDHKMWLLFRRDPDWHSAFRPKLPARLTDDLPPAPKAKPAHDCGDNHIRPRDELSGWAINSNHAPGVAWGASPSVD